MEFLERQRFYPRYVQDGKQYGVRTEVHGTEWVLGREAQIDLWQKRLKEYAATAPKKDENSTSTNS